MMGGIFIEYLFDFLLTRTFVRFIIHIEQKFDLEEPAMTTFGCIISIIGAAALSIQLTRLVAWMDRPRRSRSAA